MEKKKQINASSSEHRKLNLFESGDDNIGFTINEDYAKKYDKWREKEDYERRNYTFIYLFDFVLSHLSITPDYL